MESAFLPSGQKDFALIGRLLYERKPEVAAELSGLLIGETDLNKLKAYYIAFSAKYTAESLDDKRLFISAILTIYQPHTRRLFISLHNLLKMHKWLLHKTIEEEKARYKNPHKKAEVDKIALWLKEGV